MGRGWLLFAGMSCVPLFLSWGLVRSCNRRALLYNAHIGTQVCLCERCEAACHEREACVGLAPTEQQRQQSIATARSYNYTRCSYKACLESIRCDHSCSFVSAKPTPCTGMLV